MVSSPEGWWTNTDMKLVCTLDDRPSDGWTSLSHVPYRKPSSSSHDVAEPHLGLACSLKLLSCLLEMGLVRLGDTTGS
jgi:hypothetical protein